MVSKRELSRKEEASRKVKGESVIPIQYCISRKPGLGELTTQSCSAYLLVDENPPFAVAITPLMRERMNQSHFVRVDLEYLRKKLASTTFDSIFLLL